MDLSKTIIKQEITEEQETKQTAGYEPSNTLLKRSMEKESDQQPAKKANIGGGMYDGMEQMSGGTLGGPFLCGEHGDVPNDEVIEVINIPDNIVELVNGGGGSEIENIQVQSGCRVQMISESDPETGMRFCILHGIRTSVDNAKLMIAKIISLTEQHYADGGMQKQGQHNQGMEQMGEGSQGGPSSIRMSGGALNVDVVEIIIISNSTAELANGGGGSEFQNIQVQSGCRVQMIPVPGSAMQYCIMKGNRTSVDQAKEIIRGIITGQQGTTSQKTVSNQVIKQEVEEGEEDNVLEKIGSEKGHVEIILDVLKNMTSMFNEDVRNISNHRSSGFAPITIDGQEFVCLHTIMLAHECKQDLFQCPDALIRLGSDAHGSLAPLLRVANRSSVSEEELTALKALKKDPVQLAARLGSIEGHRIMVQVAHDIKETEKAKMVKKEIKEEEE